MKPQITPPAHQDCLERDTLTHLLLNLARAGDLKRRRQRCPVPGGPDADGDGSWSITALPGPLPITTEAHWTLTALAMRGFIDWLEFDDSPGAERAYLTLEGVRLLKSWNVEGRLTFGDSLAPQPTEWPEIPPAFIPSPRCPVCKEDIIHGASGFEPYHCRSCEIVWGNFDAPGFFPDSAITRCRDLHRPFAGFGAMLDGAEYICARPLAHAGDHAGLLVSDSEAEPARTWPLTGTRKRHYGDVA